MSINLIYSVKPAYRVIRLSYRVLTHQLRVLPDFLILGGQRCGTTSLYFYLTGLPGIFPAFRKEVHFFDDHFSEGLSWYRAQFPTTSQKYLVEHVQKHAFLTGESSPYYLFHPHIPRRVAKILPNGKFIILLRNPVDRAYSHHWLATMEGKETLPFEVAIQREEERLSGEREKMLVDENYESYNHRHFSYLARGIYVDQLKTWRETFPQKAFLILKSEDFYLDPAETLKQTLDFLGVPTIDISSNNREFKQYREPNNIGHKNIHKPAKMDSKVREYLVEYFAPHNARLYEYLGRDFGWEK